MIMVFMKTLIWRYAAWQLTSWRRLLEHFVVYTMSGRDQSGLYTYDPERGLFLIRKHGEDVGFGGYVDDRRASMLRNPIQQENEMEVYKLNPIIKAK
jgi:hypothetical protein